MSSEPSDDEESLISLASHDHKLFETPKAPCHSSTKLNPNKTYATSQAREIHPVADLTPPKVAMVRKDERAAYLRCLVWCFRASKCLAVIACWIFILAWLCVFIRSLVEDLKAKNKSDGSADAPDDPPSKTTMGRQWGKSCVALPEAVLSLVASNFTHVKLLHGLCVRGGVFPSGP